MLGSSQVVHHPRCPLLKGQGIKRVHFFSFFLPVSQEIRKAYKRLAKEWHPDKNKAEGAEARFIEITRAYELLSDPDRRRQYDNHGITEDAPNFRQKHDYAQYGRFNSDPFDSFFDDFFGGSSGGERKEQKRETSGVLCRT